MFEIRANPEELHELVASVVREVMRQQDAPAQRPDVVKLLYTDAETAAMIGVGVRTLWRMVQAGEFPQPVKIRSKTLWKAADVAAWVDKQIATNVCKGEDLPDNGKAGLEPCNLRRPARSRKVTHGQSDHAKRRPPVDPVR
jgi:predicted DNA-binding transcriptional regulator AlpA